MFVPRNKKCESEPSRFTDDTRDALQHSLGRAPAAMCIVVCRESPVLTFGGLSDPGYSLWSSLFQRCISLITIGLLKSTNWNPVTLAPPCINLSRDMSLKPWVRQKEWRTGVQNERKRKRKKERTVWSQNSNCYITGSPWIFVSSVKSVTWAPL